MANKYLLFVCFALLFTSNTIHAEIKNSKESVHVSIKDSKGNEINQEIDVIIWKDDDRQANQKVLLFAHGKPTGSTSYSNWIWIRSYGESLKELVKLGYTVVMPIRIGQGDRGGPIVELTACEGVPHRMGFEIVADQLEQVIKSSKFSPLFANSELVVVGQSMGGASAIALGSRKIDSLKTIINFAGGNGGNPQRWPRNPCESDELVTTIGEYGKSATVPSLWIYTKNDHYWGSELPVKWLNLYQKNGGIVDFRLVDSDLWEGHDYFRKNSKAWIPLVKEYLSK